MRNTPARFSMLCLRRQAEQKKNIKNNRCAASKKQFTISVDNYVNNPRNITAYTHPAARLFVTIKK